MDLHILFPSHLDSSCPPLFPQAKRNDLSVPDEFSDGLKLQFDADKTVSELCSLISTHITSTEKNSSTSLDEAIVGLSLISTEDSWVLSRLNEFEGGYHILSPFDPSAKVISLFSSAFEIHPPCVSQQIGHAIRSHPEISSGGTPTKLLLAWNGKDINHIRVERVGKTAVPIKLPLTSLVPDTDEDAMKVISDVCR